MLPASFRVLLQEKEIRSRITALGARIDADFPPGPICLVGVLKGACFFLADLARALSHPVRIDFIGVSSYGMGSSSTGGVRLTKDLDMDIAGQDVLLVEDIVDSGITLSWVLRLLEQRRPRTLRAVVLLDKACARCRPVTVDYAGFRIPNQFVVGYGLDYAEDYRNLKDICVIET